MKALINRFSLIVASFRRLSTKVDCFKTHASSKARIRSSIHPIPHCWIPDPFGQDLDFVNIAHSHLIHGDWSKLNSLAHGLNAFRFKHILLRIQKDPVLSLEFYDWTLTHSCNTQSLETHSIILHILTKCHRFRAAESIFRKILQSKISTSELFHAIISSYHLCESSPNVFDSLFKTYAHLKKFRNATDTFHWMRGYGFIPTIRSCNAFLSSLLDHGRTDIALPFFNQMSRCRISPNLYTLNMVMLAFCSSGRLEKALNIFEKMELMGVIPTVSSFNILISAFCKKGLMNTVLKLKNEMRRKGLDPNAMTYNTIIHGFYKEGKLNEANKILSEMKAMDVIPNTVTYNILLSGYSELGNAEMRLRIYEEMIKNGVKPDILTYNTIILGLCNEGKTKKAEYFVKEMDRENIVPNASTFASLIIGHCKRQNSERGFEIYKIMTKNGCSPNYEIFKILITTFCKNKDFEGALVVLNDLMEAWIIPNNDLLTMIFEGLHSLGKVHLLRKYFSEADSARFFPKAFVGVNSKSN